MKKLFSLLNSKNITQVHFAYYSIYQQHYMNFIGDISKNIVGQTAIIFSRCEKSFKSIADSLRDKHCRDKNITHQKFPFIIYGFNLSEDASEQTFKEGEGGGDIVLVNFPFGVSNEEMLALYYRSTGAVGATGDQSFIEAYTMRREKLKTAPTESGEIEYGVPEQQRKLYGQLTELEEERYSRIEMPVGVHKIKISEKVSEKLDDKPLLYPTVMLINEVLSKGIS